MEEKSEFIDELAELCLRVRLGDQQAMATFYERYEPMFRRFITRHLRSHPEVTRTVGVSDIYQLVMASFFHRVQDGSIVIESVERLVSCLATMARNKTLKHIERLYAACRDARRTEAVPAETLSAEAESREEDGTTDWELLGRIVRQRLRPAERRLFDGYAAGRSWSELGEEFEANPDALRIRLSRALRRVKSELQGDGCLAPVA